MRLTRIALDNYRCFPTRQEVELRPITVVLGKNNSGKSALVRAPLVLATGIGRHAAVPLDLDALDDAPEFIDLIHKRLEHGGITLGFTLDDDRLGRLDFDVTIQNVAEWHTQVVSRWAFHSDVTSFSLEWQASDDAQDPSRRRYVIVGASLPYCRVRVEFDGLLPRIDASDEDERLTRFGPIGDRAVAHQESIRHLGPFRERAARTEPLTRSRILNAGPSDLGRALVGDHVRRGGELIAAVNDLLAAHFPGWRLEVRPWYDAYSVGLRSTRDSDLWVTLTDSGSGITQLLPILVNRARDRIKPSPHEVLEIHEEPVLHLHPAAQAGVADVYIDAIERSRARFLIETHSETFLLRLRRRVAEGRLDPGALRLYYVDNAEARAIVRPITVDPLGNVDYWPPGVFSEDFEETKALATAQLKHEHDDAR